MIGLTGSWVWCAGPLAAVLTVSGLFLLVRRIAPPNARRCDDPDWLPPEERPAVRLPPDTRLRAEDRPYSPTIAQHEAVTEALREIPPLPRALMRILRELESAGSCAATVARTVGQEPVVAAGLLRAANAAALGVRGEARTVADAVVRLGFSTTRALFLRLNVSTSLAGGGDEETAEKLWAHSMAVSQVAEELARRAGGADPGLALTAGLLHDIGRQAINSRFADRAVALRDEDPNGRGVLERERELFGADHAAIGGCLATRWGLPHELAEMIRLHHRICEAANDLSPEVLRALRIVHVANQLVKYRHAYRKQMEIDPLPPELLAELNLPRDPQSLLDSSMESLIARSLSLGAEPASPTAHAA